MDFVDRVMTLQGDSSIKKVSLQAYTGVDSDRVDAWLRNVMKRGVSELKLSIFSEHKTYSLFPKTFESKKLVKLEINYIDIDSLDFGLPMLKTLILHSVHISADMFGILLHTLPALEELVIGNIAWKYCYGFDVDVSVSSASLKTLKIGYIGCSVSFDTPSLVHFCYSDYIARDYSLVRMENLSEARISIQVSEKDIKHARAGNNVLLDEEDFIPRFETVGNLMNGIRNVEYLELSANTIEVLSKCCESLPVFKKLKSLAIKSHKSRGWQAMPSLLRNCPSLQTLVIKILNLLKNSF